MTETRPKGKMTRLALAVYLVLSIPPMLYVSGKVVNRIKAALFVNPGRNSDFVLTNEAARGGGGVNEYPAFTDYTLIAHAGGALFGPGGEMFTYTNSREAIEQNYARGHRVFEIDFSLTRDGRLAAVHDWEHGRRITGEAWTGAPTLAEWKRAKIYGEYTTLDIDDIAGLMNTYRDMFVVTDTKETDAALALREFAEIKRAAENIDPGILDRIIPQVYYPRMLETIYAAHEFQNVIYTLYQSSQSDDEVLRFAENHPSVKAITMWPERAGASFVEALSEINIPVYVHTINRFDEAYRIRAGGVSGLYTDYLY